MRGKQVFNSTVWEHFEFLQKCIFDEIILNYMPPLRSLQPPTLICSMNTKLTLNFLPKMQAEVIWSKFDPVTHDVSNLRPDLISQSLNHFP